MLLPLVNLISHKRITAKDVAILNTTSNPVANTTDDRSTPTLAHSIIVLFYHWFASSDEIVITNTNRGGGYHLKLQSAVITNTIRGGGIPSEVAKR